MSAVAFIANTGRLRAGGRNYSYGGNSIEALINDIGTPIGARLTIIEQMGRSLSATRNRHRWTSRSGDATRGIKTAFKSNYPVDYRIHIGNEQGYVLFLEFGTSRGIPPKKYGWHDVYVKHFMNNLIFKPQWRVRTPFIGLYGSLSALRENDI